MIKSTYYYFELDTISEGKPTKKTTLPPKKTKKKDLGQDEMYKLHSF